MQRRLNNLHAVSIIHQNSELQAPWNTRDAVFDFLINFRNFQHISNKSEKNT